MSRLFFSDPGAQAVFNPEKMGKSTLFSGTTMMVGLNSFEPGQKHESHAHASADKLYFVLQGEGRFEVGEDVQHLGVGSLIVAPAGVAHGVENVGSERLVVMMALSPPPSKR